MPDESTPPARTGFEMFTGAYMPVVYDETRAAQKLPPWTSSVDGQHFMDSEVQETTGRTAGS